MKELPAQWICHTSSLLTEVLQNNEGMVIFEKPFNIFGKILGQVSDRAVIINDLELNKLMLRLTLYECADPDSNNYMGSDKLQEYHTLKTNPIPTSKEQQLKMLEQIDIKIIKQYLKDK